MMTSSRSPKSADLVGPIEKAAREQFKGNELVEKVKELRLKAINDLIDRQLILQEFRKQKFNIPEHFIDDRIATLTREEFGGDRSAFIRTLAAQGYTLEKFKQMETEKMIVQAMRGTNGQGRHRRAGKTRSWPITERTARSSRARIRSSCA
jgi:hypothetical protein